MFAGGGPLVIPRSTRYAASIATATPSATVSEIRTLTTFICDPDIVNVDANKGSNDAFSGTLRSAIYHLMADELFDGRPFRRLFNVNHSLSHY